PCGAGTLAQPGEEANGDAHGASIAAVRTLTVDARSPLADGARGSAGAPGGPRRATREPSAHREALRGLPRPPLRGPRADRALGVVPAFLLKEILNRAIPERDTTLLSLLAGGMIAISVVSGVIGVAQTLLSNQVGQRVIHDLRTAVFRHLQRLSLAFFTRTRTGEVQSRISNDIGGVQGVVTSTATSIASNVTTVVATMVAMVALSWELALFAFALIPLFVYL